MKNQNHEDEIKRRANYGKNNFLSGKAYQVHSFGNINLSLDEILSKHFYCFNCSKLLCFVRMLDVFKVNIDVVEYLNMGK